MIPLGNFLLLVFQDCIWCNLSIIIFFELQFPRGGTNVPRGGECPPPPPPPKKTPDSEGAKDHSEGTVTWFTFVLLVLDALYQLLDLVLKTSLSTVLSLDQQWDKQSKLHSS